MHLDQYQKHTGTHLDNIQSTYKFSRHIKLWISRPAGVGLQTLAYFFIRKDIKAAKHNIVFVKNLHYLSAEACRRKKGTLMRPSHF